MGGLRLRSRGRRRLLASGEGGDAAEVAGDGEPQRVWPGVLRFVVPTYALVVTNMVLTALDKSFVGRHSSVQLAALGPATAVFDCTSYLLTFLNTATLSLLGNRPEEELPALRSHALVFSGALGFLLGALLLIVATPAVRSLGAVDDMLPYAVIYLQIRCLGSVVDRIGSTSTQFWLAEKDGITPMLATLLAAVLNALGDYILCPRFGVAGAAVATVGASALSAAFLIVRLRARGLWPSPFRWPSMGDFKPFAGFAGIVFFILLMKVVTFTIMTAAATSLGTLPAAAHQILVSAFFVGGIAYGQPLSWAAQAFLPGVRGTNEQGRTVRALLTVAVSFGGLGFATSLFMLRSCLGLFTRDPSVIMEASAASLPGALASALFVLYLVLEGFAIAWGRLDAALAIAVSSASGMGLTLWRAQAESLLSLTEIWSAFTRVVAVAIAAHLLVLGRGPRKDS